MTKATTNKRAEWVIWNGLLGALDTVLIGKIEVREDGSRSAHLRSPYEMVGPFSLDELEARGFIDFAACTVMSRKRWREAQVELRRAAQEKRREFAQRTRAAEERWAAGSEAQARGHRRRRAELSLRDERRYRTLLGLPIEGALSASKINSAFRRLAKSAHPDAGGSHEEFVFLTEARAALLNGAA